MFDIATIKRPEATEDISHRILIAIIYSEACKYTDVTNTNNYTLVGMKRGANYMYLCIYIRSMICMLPIRREQLCTYEDLFSS